MPLIEDKGATLPPTHPSVDPNYDRLIMLKNIEKMLESAAQADDLPKIFEDMPADKAVKVLVKFVGYQDFYELMSIAEGIE